MIEGIVVSLSKNDKIFLGVLFVVSFLIRAFVYQMYIRQDQRYWQVDSATYHRVATSIAQGHGISLPNGQPNFYRLPGYPVFIAFFYKLWGNDPEKALWAQVVLASCIPLLIFLLAGVIFPRRRWLAYGAGVLSALHLGLVLYSSFFMTESLFIFLFLCFCLYFFAAVHLWFCDEKELAPIVQCHGTAPVWRWMPEGAAAVPSYEKFYERLQYGKEMSCAPCRGNPQTQYLFIAGIFLGLSSLVRPVGHYMLAVALCMLLCSRGTWTARIRGSCAVSSAWLLMVAAWLIRNYMLLGHLFFHTLPGGHFLYLSAARVAMHPQQCSYQQARNNLAREVHDLIAHQEHDEGHTLNEIERCYAHEAVARHYFISYPFITLKTWLTDMTRTSLSLYSSELVFLESGRVEYDYFAKNRTWWDMFKRYLMSNTTNMCLRAIVYGEIIIFFLILLGFMIGFLSMLCGRYSRAATCSCLRMLPFMTLFIIVALSGGYARMRLPIEPLLLICSLYGWLIHD
ncbi:MAG: hypothetical protein WCW33_04710 [Candidatus Babeliales bacterium]|jgi:4-amino-4-deoxy-L-arabinose transferase-like glycosyltransferase